MVYHKQYIKILRGDGSVITLAEWQDMYNLKVGSAQIGRYFSYTESRFRQDIEQFGELVVCTLLIKVLDAFRSKVNRPVRINSFNRTADYQEVLRKRGFKVATTSPHVVKLAADIDTDTEHQTRQEVKVLQQVARELNIAIRIGYEDYLKIGQTFIHVDVCPEYFAKGKPWHNLPHPPQWEKMVTW